MQRPQRWDIPFGSISESAVDALLKLAPFCSMDATAFSKAVPLRGILANDCRMHEYGDGEIVFREGDYGNSAFLILEGNARASLRSLPPTILGRMETKRKSWFRAVAQIWENASVPEQRDYAQNQSLKPGEAPRQTVFLQDIPGVMENDSSIRLSAGEMFGELAALNRSARSATVVAHEKAIMLEIRWQGLRELMLRDSALRQHIDARYRENSLHVHLHQTPLFQSLPESSIDAIAQATQFESFGNFDWQHQYKASTKKDIAQRIRVEPVIVEQGDYVNGLVLIRGGFARLSRRHGHGHQTVAYMGKGADFGLREQTHAWRTGQPVAWQLSLRAVGYVDTLRIPSATVQEHILPHLDPSELPLPIAKSDAGTPERRRTIRNDSINTSMMEFLMENRSINGTATMMIDLDRCTRCDDCLRACATAHDNNPRFVRQGKKHENYMIAHACMHCADPVCMIGCPTGAIGRDQTTGTVTINDQTCVGCSTCANSCPYDNIRMVEIRDRNGKPLVDAAQQQPIVKATKCDLCVEQRGGPACQRACPHDALVRIDLTRPDALQNLLNR